MGEAGIKMRKKRDFVAMQRYVPPSQRVTAVTAEEWAAKRRAALEQRAAAAAPNASFMRSPSAMSAAGLAAAGAGEGGGGGGSGGGAESTGGEMLTLDAQKFAGLETRRLQRTLRTELTPWGIKL